MSELKGFRLRAKAYGLPEEMALKLPIEPPARDDILEVLMEAGADGDVLCNVEAKLLAYYTAATAPAPAGGSGPQRVVLETEKITAKSLAEKINEGDRDAETVASLDKKVGGAAVFVTKADGTLDIEAMQQGLAHLNKFGEAPAKINGRTPRTLRAALATVEPMNPMTGAALTPGDKWFKVPADHRVYVAFLQARGILAKFAEPVVREAAAAGKIEDTVIGDDWADFQALEPTDEEKLAAHGRAFKKNTGQPKPVETVSGDLFTPPVDRFAPAQLKGNMYAREEGTRERADAPISLGQNPIKAFDYEINHEDGKNRHYHNILTTYERNLQNLRDQQARGGFNLAVINEIEAQEVVVHDIRAMMFWSDARLEYLRAAKQKYSNSGGGENYSANLTGSGSISQGRGAQAAGAGGVNVGNVSGGIHGSTLAGRDVDEELNINIRRKGY